MLPWILQDCIVSSCHSICRYGSTVEGSMSVLWQKMIDRISTASRLYHLQNFKRHDNWSVYIYWRQNNPSSELYISAEIQFSCRDSLCSSMQKFPYNTSLISRRYQYKLVDQKKQSFFISNFFWLLLRKCLDWPQSYKGHLMNRLKHSEDSPSSAPTLWGILKSIHYSHLGGE